MTIHGRREFLKAGSIAVGTIAAQGCAASVEASATGSQVAAFGWEVSNLYGNGANIYMTVLGNIILNSINVDVSASILSGGTPGFAEVLCVGGVSRQAVPTLNNTGGHAYPNFAPSSIFGSVTPQNPNGLTLYFDHKPNQDQFFSVILKTWVPADGTASATSRQFVGQPQLAINSGDYLVFHMDHEGVALDAEMQIVLAYSPA